MPADAQPMTAHVPSPRVARRAAPSSALLMTSGVLVALVLGVLVAMQPLLGFGAFVGLVLVVGTTRSGIIGVSGFILASYFDIIGEYTGAALSPVKLLGGALIGIAALSMVLQARRRLARPAAGEPIADAADGAPGWVRHPLLVAFGVAFVSFTYASAAWATDLSQVKSLSVRLTTELLVLLSIPVLVRSGHHLRVMSWTILVGAALSTLVGKAMGAEILGRAMGTFTDPNEFAAALVPAIVLGLTVCESSRSAFARWSARVLSAWCAFGVLDSGSRGGMLALVVAFFVVLITARGRERVRLTGVLCVVVSVGLAWLVLTPAGGAIMARITDSDSSGRTDLWHVAIRQWQANPVHGVGVGNYPIVSRNYLDASVQRTDLFIRDARVVHSTPLEMLAELGTVGFVLYYGLVLSCIWVAMRALRAARRLEEDQTLVALGRGIVGALLAIQATTVFLSGQYQELAWILMGAAVAYGAIVRHAAMQPAVATSVVAEVAAAEPQYVDA